MQQSSYNASTSYVQRTRARLHQTFLRFELLYSRSGTPAGICTAQYIATERVNAALRKKGEVSA